MAYDLFAGDYEDPVAKAAYLMNLFSQVRPDRANFEIMWEESASLCWPEYRNSFTFGHVRTPGAKYTEYQVDGSGSIHSHRFMSICDAMITPYNLMWSVFKPSGKNADYLKKDPNVRAYFQALTRIVWEERYKPCGNFVASQQQNYQNLGVFGGQTMLIDELDYSPENTERGIRYISLGAGQVYLLTNHQGRVTGAIRHFRWTARQAYSCWKDKIPVVLKAPLEQNSATRFDFLHFILPRTDYDPRKIFSMNGKPYWSCYLSVAGTSIVEEGGYRKFPIAHGRYTQAPEEDYGRGPAQIGLAELKTKNAEKSTYLRVGHRKAEPTWLIGDDGLLDFKSHPGAYNYGGYTEDGKPLVTQLPTGDFEVAEKMLEASDRIIGDAFLTSLFPLIFDDKGRQRSPREVIEMANDRGMFLAPTLGRQLTEYLPVIVDRELDILASLGRLPPKPPILREAKGEYGYEVAWTGPLGRALSNMEISGYMRSVEMASEIAQKTGDMEVMDRFDNDAAMPEIMDAQFVPSRWVASDKKVATKRKDRQQAQAEENRVKSLPGEAAMAKAQAITAKAQTGGNIGGTLSGTPEGGMPMMPGQSAPGGRAFGL